MLATLHLYIRAWKLLSSKKCAMRMQLSPRSCQNMVSLVFDHMYTCLLVPGEWRLCLWTVVCLPSPCLSGYTAFQSLHVQDARVSAAAAPVVHGSHLFPYFVILPR